MNDVIRDGDVPPPPNRPSAPPFGWVTNWRKLTREETAGIAMAAGVDSFRDVPGEAMPGLVAVAFARRWSPDAYPWEVADRIPFEDLMPADDDQDDDQEDEEAAYAEAVTEAALNGEEPPLPPSSGD